jgi:hypothetical protein
MAPPCRMSNYSSDIEAFDSLTIALRSLSALACSTVRSGCGCEYCGRCSTGKRSVPAGFLSPSVPTDLDILSRWHGFVLGSAEARDRVHLFV